MEDKQSFLDLVNELYTENRESSLNKLVYLFKNQKEIINLLTKECESNSDVNELNNLQFLNLLINLPQITGNIFQLLNELLFIPETYYDTLCSIIYESLKIVQ